ncbi:MAG: hybrid sensor histidine kinase/response regulator [Marinifilaceae bacterium]|jgi:CheY-like chemotaxis protein|nr:hybrid sensor histidine kinase/response regulator [Marinifilaceae bacterium]
MKKYKVLAVDDIIDNIRVLQSILDSEVYELDYALSGKEAIKKCVMNDFDLILLDIMMPGMDGYETCEYLKSKLKTKDIPIIFVTAMNDSEAIIKGFEIGGQDYVTKPYNPKELCARVKTQIDLKVKNESLKRLNLELEERVAARTLELYESNLDLAKANKKLTKLEEAKGDYLFLMSSELRNPLNGIIGFSDMLEYSIKNKTHLKYVKLIKQACENLIGVSDTALLLSALRFEKYDLNKSEVSLNQIFKACSESLNLKLKDRKIKLKIATKKQFKIDADEDLLKLCFTKLLENSIYNAPAKSSVKISFVDDDNSINIIIEDKGMHFENNSPDYNFTFYKPTHNEKETKRLTSGLIVVKLILDLHNFGIDVANNIDGGVQIKINIFKKND